MRSLKFFGLLIIWMVSATSGLYAQVETIAEFQGLQLTGVTVSEGGRIFVNFPRWREGVPLAVAEVNPETGAYSPYPNEDWNAWEINQPPREDAFMAVQSVVSKGNELFVLDTRNPMFAGVKDAPRIFVFNLETNELVRTYIFSEGSYLPGSYINDLRVDVKRRKIYLTDSGEGALLLLDAVSGESTRLLADHPSTKAETDHLTVDGQRWDAKVHADGIAFDVLSDLIYYHSLTGYTLYAIKASALNGDRQDRLKGIKKLGTTAAPDGMITDDLGNLYFADLENHKIQYRDPQGVIHTLLEGDMVSWADTFSIHNGYLYYTNSRIHQASGDISGLKFQLNRVSLPSE